MKNSKKFLELEKKIGYEFENFDLLVNALTHSSYANEHHIAYKGNNERLEFLGDAVLQAKAFVGNEPFVVMLGDDLMDITNDDALPLTKQLMNDYDETHASTIAVMEVPHEEVSSYGVIAPQGEGINGLYSVETFVEKPNPEDAPSDLAIIGRYLLTPEIFDILANQEPGAGNEIQLTDAIDTLNKTQRVFAREFKGQRYDVGDKFGFMKTSIDYALKHPQVKDDLKQYIIDLGKQLEESEQTTD